MKYENLIKYTSPIYYVIYIIKGVDAVLYLFKDLIEKKIEIKSTGWRKTISGKFVFKITNQHGFIKDVNGNWELRSDLILDSCPYLWEIPNEKELNIFLLKESKNFNNE